MLFEGRLSKIIQDIKTSSSKKTRHNLTSKISTTNKFGSRSLMFHFLTNFSSIGDIFSLIICSNRLKCLLKASILKGI